jgi:hypothetical protein
MSHRLLNQAALPCILVALGFPGAATGQETVAPPGNSGVDQYLEVVPGARGERPPGRTGRPALSPQAQRELEQHGQSGSDLARIVDATAPERRPTQKPRPNRGRKDAGDDRNVRSRIRALPSAASSRGDGGMGIALPLALGASTVALAASALLRWRRG